LEDSADTNLALAEDLWRQGQKLCGSVPESKNPIDRVLARLSKQ